MCMDLMHGKTLKELLFENNDILFDCKDSQVLAENVLALGRSVFIESQNVDALSETIKLHDLCSKWFNHELDDTTTKYSVVRVVNGKKTSAYHIFKASFRTYTYTTKVPQEELKKLEKAYGENVPRSVINDNLLAYMCREFINRSASVELLTGKNKLNKYLTTTNRNELRNLTTCSSPRDLVYRVYGQTIEMNIKKNTVMNGNSAKYTLNIPEWCHYITHNRKDFLKVIQS